MPFHPDADLEPIPGYRLIERLGGGGFGEVWKCEAPGGLHKAMKLVFGDLEDVSQLDETIKAEQELRSLERIKRIRHPFILNLERYEIVDGQLLIVTELADCSLYDRFREYRHKGVMGIPREELLGYLTEAAEALDVMTREHDLLHLDIKPQNLFLVYNHIKIGDFGLVKDLEGMNANVTGGVTPVYAAPETFEGYVSRFSDQYSLAIVYQELLTGVRPFGGHNTKQLMLQHIQGQPNLDPLPPADRPIIARALSKTPTERWENCSALVQALRSANAPASGDAPTEPAAMIETAQPNTSGSVPSSRSRRAGTTGERLPPSHHTQARPAPLAKGESAPEPSPGAAGAQRGGRTDYFEIGPVSGDSRGGPRDAADPGAPGADNLSSLSGAQAKAASEQEEAPSRRDAGMDGLHGVLRPTVLIGLGQFGRTALAWMRRELIGRFGPSGLPLVRMMAIDTDPSPPSDDLFPPLSSAGAAGGKGPDAALEELFLARLSRPARYIRSRDSLPPVENWLDVNLLYRMPRTNTTSGIRALGRLAFIEHYGALAARLERDFAAATQPANAIQSGKLTGLGLQSREPRVFIVGHLGGGTAGGMFLDCAYVVRHMLRKRGIAKPEVIGLFFIPDNAAMEAPDLAEANAVAALLELNHYQQAAPPSPPCQGGERGGVTPGGFSAVYESNSAPIEESGPPFSHCFLVEAPKRTPPSPPWQGGERGGPGAPGYQGGERGGLQTRRERGRDRDSVSITQGRPVDAALGGKDPARPVIRHAADCLLRLILTGAGRAITPPSPPCQGGGDGSDRGEAPLPPLAKGGTEGGSHRDQMRIGSLGVRVLSSPRRPLLRRTSRLIFGQVIDYWLHPATPEMAGPVRERIDGFFHYESLQPEQILARLEKALTQSLGQSAESLAQQTIAPFAHTIQEKLPEAGQVKSALRKIIASLGASSPQQEPLAIGQRSNKSAASPVDSTLTPGNGPSPDTRVARTLREQSERIVRVAGPRMIYAIFRHLDKAVLRLGAAEEALRYTQAALDAWTTHHESKGQQANVEFAQALTYLRNDLAEYHRLASQPKRRLPSMPTPAERLLAVFRARYRALMHECLAMIYSELRALAKDQAKNLEICRCRIEEMHALTKSLPEHPEPASGRVYGRETETMLMPPGYRDMLQAVAGFSSSIGVEELNAFDVRLEERLSHNFPHLAETLMAPGESHHAVAQIIFQELTAFLESRLVLDDVAGLVMKKESSCIETLEQLYAEARPHLDVAEEEKGRETVVLLVPDSASGKKVARLAEQVLPDVRIIAMSKCDEIIVVRTLLDVQLPQLAVLSEAGLNAYHTAMEIEHFTPHARQDIKTWRIPEELGV